MKWCKAFRIARRLVRADRHSAPETAHFRVRLLECFEDVLSACTLFSDTPSENAAAYCAAILKNETDPGWWQKHQNALTEPWFILRYCREHWLIEEKSDSACGIAPIVICPEEADETRRVQLVLERDLHFPEEGYIRIDSTNDEALTEILQGLRFTLTERGYLRKVSECSGPLSDRAAEIGLELLKRRYTLYLTDSEAADRIRTGKIAPVHRYWIRETGQPEILRLTYPRDKVLHQYVCAAGGRWNGKYVEFPIVCYERLGDLIRLYDFHMTRTANQYIDAWQEATRQAVVYRTRREEEGKPRPTAQDVFHRLLGREIVVPDDLKDSG